MYLRAGQRLTAPRRSSALGKSTRFTPSTTGEAVPPKAPRSAEVFCARRQSTDEQPRPRGQWRFSAQPDSSISVQRIPQA